MRAVDAYIEVRRGDGQQVQQHLSGTVRSKWRTAFNPYFLFVMVPARLDWPDMTARAPGPDCGNQRSCRPQRLWSMQEDCLLRSRRGAKLAFRPVQKLDYVLWQLDLLILMSGYGALMSAFI
jgi:hypothetical protein